MGKVEKVRVLLFSGPWKLCPVENNVMIGNNYGSVPFNPFFFFVFMVSCAL